MKALLTSFDLLLVVVAFLIMALGLVRRWSLWRKKKPADVSGDWSGLGSYLLGHGKILKRSTVGGAHLAAFWGVVIPLMVIILAHSFKSMALSWLAVAIFLAILWIDCEVQKRCRR